MESSTDQRRSDLRKLCIHGLSEDQIKDKIEEIRGWKNGTLLWKIENPNDYIRNYEKLFSEPFYSSPDGHRMKVKVRFECSGRFQTQIKFLPAVEGEPILPSPKYIFPEFHFRLTYAILDQSDRQEKRHSIEVYEPNFGTSPGRWAKEHGDTWITNFVDLLHDDYKDVYYKNKTMFVTADLEPLENVFGNYFSRDGVLVWKIDNYARTRKESRRNINGIVSSEYFYSSDKGYRMQSQIWWWDSEYVYFYLRFLVGENDADLPDVYPHKCTITLINQRDDSGKNDFVVGTETLDPDALREGKGKQMMTFDSCHGMFVTNTTIEKEPYLVDDAMIVKVVVEKL